MIDSKHRPSLNKTSLEAPVPESANDQRRQIKGHEKYAQAECDVQEGCDRDVFVTAVKTDQEAHKGQA